MTGRHYHIGTGPWLEASGVSLPSDFVRLEAEKAQQAQTSVWVAQDQQVVAILFLEDELREDAIEMIARLKARGKRVTLLSGDRQAVAETVAEKLGGMSVHAEVLPEQNTKRFKPIKKTVNWWRWSVTALTMRRRWLAPMSVLPSVRERMCRWIAPTLFC